MAGKIIITEGVAPAAPVGTGKHSVYIDSADKKIKYKDDAGTVGVIASEDYVGSEISGVVSMLPDIQTPTSVALGQVYTAATAGFLIGRGSPTTDDSVGFDIYSDDNTDPTTLVGRLRTSCDNGDSSSFNIPIVKGKKYKVTGTNVSSSVIAFYPLSS